jgi:acetylornithine aminotransferase/acetylornithine/N-succinyldiaminopimelate aminotransferase
MLLMMDGVQCGHFRTGRFQSFQRLLEGIPGAESFLPDALSMAKSLGGGFPIGAFWVRQKAHGVDLADLLGPGTHGTTFGGTPLACAVALKILEIIDRDGLADHVRTVGSWLTTELGKLTSAFPGVVKGVRGIGFMQGLELQPRDQIPGFARSDKPASLQMVHQLQETGVLTIPSGNQVVRLLPALNLPQDQLAEGLDSIRRVLQRIA